MYNNAGYSRNRHSQKTYVRGSAFDQNSERQIKGIQVDRIFIDKASGKDVHREQLGIMEYHLHAKAALDHIRQQWEHYLILPNRDWELNFPKFNLKKLVGWV